MPTSSAILASLRLSGQLPDQRSGTSVTARPDEQFAPNKPILSLFALCIDMRSCRDGAGASTVPPEVLFDVCLFDCEVRIRGCRKGFANFAIETLAHGRGILNGHRISRLPPQSTAVRIAANEQE